MKMNEDGSYDVYFSPKAPKGHEENWIPTGEDFFLLFRLALTQTRALNILDLGESKPLQIGRVHDSWYGHPGVSSDLLLLLLYNAAPLERGLIEHWDEYGSKTYRFPEDYKQTLQEILGAHKDALSRQYEAVIE